MNKQVVVDVFSVYETIKDSMKVTRRSINKNLFTLHYQTDFFAEGKNDALDKMVRAENELDDIMVLSIFASFERELRASIQDVVVANMSVINDTVERINLAAIESIERWTVTDIIDILKDVVSDELRGRAKQIYEYRNWVAHGKNRDHLPSSMTDPKTAYAVLSDFIDMAKDTILSIPSLPEGGKMINNLTAKYTKLPSGGYMGQLIEWPEVITEGSDLEECRASLKDAVEQMVRAYNDQKKEIPIENALFESFPVETV